MSRHRGNWGPGWFFFVWMVLLPVGCLAVLATAVQYWSLVVAGLILWGVVVVMNRRNR